MEYIWIAIKKKCIRMVYPVTIGWLIIFMECVWDNRMISHGNWNGINIKGKSMDKLNIRFIIYG